jgi:PPE family protein
MGGWSSGPGKRAHDSWDYRWEKYTHQELYNMVKTNAQGAGAVGPTYDAWDSFATLIEESQANIEKLLADAGASWEGQAADSMQQGVSPLAAWAGEATSAGQASVQSTQAHMDAFSHVANSMPEPVDVPSRETNGVPPGSFFDYIDGQNDEDPVAQKSDGAKERAVELMNKYTASTKDASGTLGTFDPPDDVGVSAAPAGSDDDAGGMIDSDDYRDSGPGGDTGDTGGGSDGGYGGPGGYGGSSPYPAGGPPAGPSSGTDTAQTGPGGLVPPAAAKLPSSSTTPASTSNPFGPISGTLFPPGGSSGGAGSAGGRRGGGGGRGGGSGYSGGAPGALGTPGGPAEGAPGARPGVGSGPLGEGSAVRGGVAATPGAKGGAPTGGMPMGGAGGGRGEEDKERNSPQYMRDYHDEFWDDSPPVAPPVIGEDDD